jgi:hypothetical protein
MKLQISVALALLFSVPAAGAQEKPSLPFSDWGSCPFECCTYGDWRATKALDAHQDRSDKSPVSFHIAAGQSVHAVTGVVITTKYGVTQVMKPIKLGYLRDAKAPKLSLAAGDVLYTLHYQGEASDLFWYHGKMYSDQIDVPDDSFGAPPHASALKVLSRPAYEWWVEVHNAGGNAGWIKPAHNFSGGDACD